MKCYRFLFAGIRTYWKRHRKEIMGLNFVWFPVKCPCVCSFTLDRDIYVRSNLMRVFIRQRLKCWIFCTIVNLKILPPRRLSVLDEWNPHCGNIEAYRHKDLVDFVAKFGQDFLSCRGGCGTVWWRRLQYLYGSEIFDFFLSILGQRDRFRRRWRSSHRTCQVFGRCCWPSVAVLQKNERTRVEKAPHLPWMWFSSARLRMWRLDRVQIWRGIIDSPAKACPTVFTPSRPRFIVPRIWIITSLYLSISASTSTLPW